MDKKVGCWVWPVLVIGSLLFLWGFCIGSIAIWGKISGNSIPGQSAGDAFIDMSVIVLIPLIIGLVMLGISIFTLVRNRKQPSSFQSASSTTDFRLYK